MIYPQRYKVYYTMNPDQQLSSWNTMVVDNNQLTTINELTPLSVYTIRVQAFTSVGPGPLSSPVQVKMQQGGKYYAWRAPKNNNKIIMFDFVELCRPYCLHNYCFRITLIYPKNNFNSIFPYVAVIIFKILINRVD